MGERPSFHFVAFPGGYVALSLYCIGFSRFLLPIPTNCPTTRSPGLLQSDPHRTKKTYDVTFANMFFVLTNFLAIGTKV